MESILSSIKKLLGINEDDTSFDIDIIIHVNTALYRLRTLGIGPETGFYISNKDSVWTDFIGSTSLLESVKTYVFIKTKLIFDPPSSSIVAESYNSSIRELEWLFTN